MQTVGPRSKAYYESIPARIDTGLNRRSDSEDSLILTNKASYVLEPVRLQKSQEKEDKAEKRHKKKKSYSQQSVAKVNKPDSRMESPDLKINQQSLMIEDPKSLRQQLQFVRN